MNRYRLRLDSGRVIGPFNIKDYAELVKKHHLSGQEEYQLFPTGDWELLDSFPELEKIYEKSQLSVKPDDTFMLNLKDIIEDKHTEEIEIKEDRLKSEAPKEFQYESEDPVLPEDEKNKNVEKAKERSFEIEAGEPTPVNIDETHIVKEKQEDIDDKTRINPEYQKYLKQKLKEENEEEKRKELERQKSLEEQIEIVEPDYNSEKTELINLKEIKHGLESALEIEEDFIEIEKKKKKAKRLSVEDEEEIEEVEEKSPMRKLLFIVGIIIVMIAFLFPDEKQPKKLKKISIKDPKFSFPMRNPIIDKDKAKKAYDIGMKQYGSHKYLGYMAASKSFTASLGFSFDNNDAGSKLIFIYSLLLEGSKNKPEDIKSVYNLVQYFKKKSYDDPGYATAIANFYYVAGKYNAALNIIDRYLAVESNKLTMHLFAVYLNVLLKTGDIIKAEEAIKALEKNQVKDLFIIKSMYKYYKDQNLIKKQLGIIKKVQMDPKLSNSVYFLLEKAELFLKEGDLKEVQELLYRINQQDAEHSRLYYARYLKSLGLFYASKKNYKKAILNIQRSIKVFELPDLIGDLSSIQSTENNVVNEMIKLSKVKVLNKSANKKLKENKINEAFKIAAQSTELLPQNIDTRILLSKIQIKKGYYDDALEQIKKLYESNRDNVEVLYELVNLYVDMYKFRSAEEHLQMIQDKSTWQYASVRAKLYRIKGEFGLGINWLIKAINLNQLDEKNIFSLAKFYIRFHKYNKAKMALTRVMDLDPLNVKYKITYAKILYEVETAASAIGYLYDVLKDFPDNPFILSEIGIYYYRSGQIKNYENIKEKLEGVSRQDSNMYNFLVESAKLDDDYEKVVKFSYKVVEIDPGDLDTRIYLAEVLMQLRRFKEAKEQLDEIKKRFSSYPRLNYFYAKFYLLINDMDKAVELALAERKQNPGVVDGALLLGDIYKKKKEIFKAREYYLVATQIEPKNVDGILGLAYIAFHSNQFDLAIDQYQKAISIEETRAETYKLLGDVYKKLGQTQPAVNNYKQFLELSPNSRYKSSLMDYIQKVE